MYEYEPLSKGKQQSMLPDILPGIRSPGDLKRLSHTELNRLSSEIRELIVSTVSRNGRHLASNLGVVELTIAQSPIPGSCSRAEQ